MFLLSLLAVILVISVSDTTTREPCHVKSPNLEQCLNEKLQEIIPRLCRFGSRELMIPPLDPLYVPELHLKYNNSFQEKVIQVEVVLRESFFQGLRYTRVLDIRTHLEDPDNQVIETDVLVPWGLVEGSYNAKGSLGNHLIDTGGLYNISVANVTTTITVEGRLVNLNGQLHLKVHKVGMRPEIGDLEFYATKIIDDDDELNNQALLVINELWWMFYEDLLPVVEQRLDDLLRESINSYSLSTPYHQLWLL